MVLLAALAAAITPPAPARATVRIVQAQRVDGREWERAARRREVVRVESGRRTRIRLIEFE